MHFISTKLPIISLGAIELSLPILSAGTNTPRILIINNLHGDELTGFYVLEKLIGLLPKNIKGSLNIITSANPLGLANRQRLIPLNNTDPNRGYPNRPQTRGITSALRSELTKIAMQHDFIIDLHTFMKPCLSAGLLMTQASEKNNNLIKQCINVSNVDAILKINTAGMEKKINSALGFFLIKQKKLFLALEYNPIRQISNNDAINKFAHGLLNILSTFGTVDQKINITKNLPTYERQQQIFSDTGLFIPQKKLGENINTNETIGFLINPSNLKRSAIPSLFEGTITEIADRQFYLFGDKIATIGKAIL